MMEEMTRLIVIFYKNF